MFMQTSFSDDVLVGLSLVVVLVGPPVQEIRAVSMSPDVFGQNLIAVGISGVGGWD